MILINLFTVAATILSLVVPLWSKRIIDCERCGIEHVLQSPAIGIDINSESVTAAIKYADGTLSQLARVPASDELRTLMQEWAKDPIALSPQNDAPESGSVDGDPLTPEVDILYKPLKALIDQSSAQFPGLDLHHQYYALSLPPFVHKRHFRRARQAARKIGLIATQTGTIAHSDEIAHMMYNAMYCLYHEHPHNPLCLKSELESSVFDSLVIDYTSSFLTITWQDTYGPFSLRKGGFVDANLGARLPRDRQYWVAMEESIASLVQSINRERDKLPRPGLHGNQLIFLGELGADDLLRSFLHDAFTGTPFDFDNVVIHDAFDPVFASALSAAGVEKAVMDAPELYNCEQQGECEELRERIYEEAKRNNIKNEL